ncbi:uncharacterized protein LOC107268643 isoform X1 [Cephus cinctus]|uniref:Uncharacterized protein LOC107268643 isoform X1 n=1 Tax=Cephus cinctus TaxID=211228 RepID=A0AAJ7W286_CEPCN|nr:uncharacterized protein LOC107268643 isoform X1 [Cephus cinctus]
MSVIHTSSTKSGHRKSTDLGGLSRDNEGVRSSVIIVQEGSDVQNVPESIEILEFTGHDNISITPSYMEFRDASEGTTYRQLMIIQNTGNKPALIRICAPNSIAFKIRTLESGVLLSPGLTISRQVEYSYKRPSLLHAMIPIQINGTFVDYHVVCSLATECISMQPSCIDFGIVDIGCSSGVKILTIMNNGGKSTRFSVDLGKNDLEINVKPTRGVVRLYSHIELRVELIGTKEGTFYSEFWIKSTPNVRIPIRVNIIIPRLVVYHLNMTGDFTLIDFSPTFMNTENYNTLVLRNLSSQITSFVVLGEVDNELFSIKVICRSISCSVYYRYFISTLNNCPQKTISAKTQPAYRAFKIYPTEGRMQPFEGIVFRIVFSPTPKLMHQTRHLKTTECQDFMVFIRILRVHCTEVADVISAYNELTLKNQLLYKFS